jgi:hypothetical protein
VKALDASPSMAPYLKQMGLIPQKIVDTLRFDDQEESRRFIALWDSLTPASRSLVGLDALALGIGITPRRLWEIFNGALMIQSREMVGGMIALALPEVFKITIKNAKKSKGYADREHLYKVSGSLPTPKGSVTNINLGEKKELEAPDDDEGGMLEAADDQLMRFSRAMQTKALPKPEPEIIDAEVDEEE